MRGRGSSRAFTLIELLVVVAIIAVLAALLFPSLRTARYRGKVSACSSNLRQIVAGLSAYASDNNGWYPQRGTIRNSFTQLNGGTIFNIVPIITPYYGGTLDVFNCPVLPSKRLTNVATAVNSTYALFFNSFGTEPTPAVQMGGLGPRSTQYDVNGKAISTGGMDYYYGSGNATMNITAYFAPLGGLMRKVGDAWRRTASDTYFNLIAADMTINYGGSPSYNRRVNHHEFSPEFRYPEVTVNMFGNVTGTNFWWATPSGSQIYPPMSGNFAAGDGSVRSYQIPRGVGANGTMPSSKFTSVANQVVPLDFQVK
jgi:prepilin-type N-terminal cleavage/methylation domain-containing protein